MRKRTHPYQQSDLPPGHGETMPPCAICGAKYRNDRHKLKPTDDDTRALEQRRYAERSA